MIESSKSMKNLKPADVDALKQFAATNAASHTHSFLRGKDAGQKGAAASQLQMSNAGEPTIELDPADADKKKKAKKIDLVGVWVKRLWPAVATPPSNVPSENTSIGCFGSVALNSLSGVTLSKCLAILQKAFSCTLFEGSRATADKDLFKNLSPLDK